MAPNPVSRATPDGERTGGRANTAGRSGSGRARSEFPPSPKSVRTWAVPLPAEELGKPELPEGDSVLRANKPSCKSQFAAIVIGAVFGMVFLAILAGVLTWLLARATQN